MCAERRRATQGARSDSCSFCDGQNVCRADGFLKIFHHIARAMFVLRGEAERFSKSGLTNVVAVGIWWSELVTQTYADHD